MSDSYIAQINFFKSELMRAEKKIEELKEKNEQVFNYAMSRDKELSATRAELFVARERIQALREAADTHSRQSKTLAMAMANQWNEESRERAEAHAQQCLPFGMGNTYAQTKIQQRGKHDK